MTLLPLHFPDGVTGTFVTNSAGSMMYKSRFASQSVFPFGDSAPIEIFAVSPISYSVLFGLILKIPHSKSNVSVYLYPFSLY